MSLATTGGGMGMGGAGAGGLSMAHGGNSMAAQQAGMPPPTQEAPNVSGTAAPPASAAALGADLIDKQQLSLKQAKNLSHLPLVAVDLHATEPMVAMYPAKPDDPSQPIFPTLIGKMKGSVHFKANETAHKTLRKFLTHDKTFEDMTEQCLTSSADATAVALTKPYKWLGLRRLDEAPAFFKTGMVVDSDGSAPAIAEDAASGVGVSLANSTLDGSSSQGDDFDRVVCKVRLHASKKSLTVLPEEGVQILLKTAQNHVAMKTKTDQQVEDFPVALALPCWALHDAAVEALMDATVQPAVLFPRGLAALAGALLPNPKGEMTDLLTRLDTVRKTIVKEYNGRLLKEPDLILEDALTVVLMGMTDEGMECTAVELSGWNTDNACALFGNLNVLSNYSELDANPTSRLAACAKGLEETLEAMNSDGPSAIVFYGAEQEKLQAEWKTKKSMSAEWGKVPVFGTPKDCVATGTAILGAISHGRLTRIVNGGKKPKAVFAIHTHLVAPVAVGVSLHYHGGKGAQNNTWTPIKTIFDFDRRVPAGPYPLDLNAAECVVHRSGAAKNMSEEELLKATKNNEGAKHIPVREEAALQLCVQLYQKTARNGTWTKVGNVLEPLIKLDKDEKKIACERVDLNLSLGGTGIMATELAGERESVVQAVKSARWAFWKYVVGVAFCVLFFGGFLVRSYWEEYAFKRDTKRLLAYYKRAMPGSIADGDLQNARYLVWKYRYKKQTLWKILEKKYGIPVLHPHEWQDEIDDDDENENEEETLDLDEGSAKEPSEDETPAEEEEEKDL